MNNEAHENKMIYLVSTGIYSCFRIRAVCSTKEGAERIKKEIDDSINPTYVDTKRGLVSNENIDIHEYELDKMLNLVNMGLQLWRVAWIDDFKSVETRRFFLDSYYEDGDKIDKLGNWHDLDENRQPKSYNYTTWCLCDNEEHARKIALERFIKFKAE